MHEPSYRLGILMSTGSAFLGRGLTLATGIILAKTLLPETLGKFIGDQSLVFIGVGLINLGIGHGYRQIASRNPKLRDSYLLPTIFVRLVAMLVYLGGVTVYLSFIGCLNMQPLTVACAALVFQLVELFQIDLQIVRSYSKVVVLNISSASVLFLAALLCWRTDANYNILIYSYLFLTLLLVVLSWLLVKPKCTTILTFDYRTLFRISIPFSAGILVYWFMSFWGLAYIREALGNEQAGYYSVPLKVHQIALVVGMSVAAVTLPLYHKLAVRKQFEMYAKVFSRLIRGTWFLAGPIVAVCYFIPEFIIRILATERYMAAAPIFPWIGFGIMFRLLAIPAGNILESVDKQWYRVAIQAIGAIICTLAVIFVVPRWGIIGAAWTLFAMDLWLMLGYWFVSHHFAPKVVALTKVFIPCSVLVVTLLLIFYCLDVSVWLKLLVFCGVWVGYVLMVLNFKEELGSIWKSILERRHR